jgi:hypothetical protein
MHALLTKARRTSLTQFDIKCRAFDIMVESVLWYGWQVWGPQLFCTLLRSNPFGTQAEKVHSAYACIMSGAGKGVALHVLHQDLHRLLIMFHWAILAARWWKRMFALRIESNTPMACAVEDIQLAMGGCTTCWSSHLLHTMHVLGLLQAGWRSQSKDWLAQQYWQDPPAHPLNPKPAHPGPCVSHSPDANMMASPLSYNYSRAAVCKLPAVLERCKHRAAKTCCNCQVHCTAWHAPHL